MSIIIVNLKGVEIPLYQISQGLKLDTNTVRNMYNKCKKTGLTDTDIIVFILSNLLSIDQISADALVNKIIRVKEKEKHRENNIEFFKTKCDQLGVEFIQFLNFIRSHRDYTKHDMQYVDSHNNSDVLLDRWFYEMQRKTQIFNELYSIGLLTDLTKTRIDKLYKLNFYENNDSVVLDIIKNDVLCDPKIKAHIKEVCKEKGLSDSSIQTLIQKTNISKDKIDTFLNSL